MIQLLRSNSIEYNLIRLDLEDKMTNEYRPLVTLTSQFTGNSKTFVVDSINFFWSPRYVQLLIYTNPTPPDNLYAGTIYVGDKDFPLGFYDVTIYQNSEGGNEPNLDPTGLPILFVGLANITSNSTTNPVKYTEYTTNDTETDTIYITNS
tara:strand:+ start:523 stop:972 length:450 start_codon:yes stop_codon:yes gene_type:complete